MIEKRYLTKIEWSIGFFLQRLDGLDVIWIMQLAIHGIMRSYYRRNARSVLRTEKNDANSASSVIHEKHGTIFTTVVALSGEIFSCIRKSIVCWATSTSRRAVTFSRHGSCTRAPTPGFARIFHNSSLGTYYYYVQEKRPSCLKFH